MITSQKVVKRLFPAGLPAGSYSLLQPGVHNMIIQPSFEGWITILSFFKTIINFLNSLI